MIISLYAGGMTVRDIQHHLARTLGTELSHDTISKIIDEVAEEVKAWQARPLEEIYPIIYLDALVVKVRDGHHVRNKAAHLAVGVDLDGVKHVLGIWVQAVEGAKFWAGVCAELRNRGVRDVLIVCCDGFTGFPEAVEATWPAATVQTCTVHLIRAAMRFVSYTDRKKVAAALRPIYTAPTVEAAETELLAFAESSRNRRAAVCNTRADTSTATTRSTRRSASNSRTSWASPHPKSPTVCAPQARIAANTALRRCSPAAPHGWTGRLDRVRPGHRPRRQAPPVLCRRPPPGGPAPNVSARRGAPGSGG
jgi:transposase-like protein